MGSIRLLQHLRERFPRLRHRLTLREVAPLALFALLYTVAIFGAEIFWGMRFSWKPAFWLGLVLPWFWWMHATGASGLRGWRGQVALFIRLALVGLFVALLAEPRFVRRSDALSLVYALDVSDSIGQTVADQSRAWISESVAKKPATDEAGLVVFARDAAVESPPRKTFALDGLNSVLPRDATDLGKALRMAAAILPDGNPGRIVLITDGNQTEGEVLPAVDELKARGIAVDVVGVDFDLEKEVWIERLDLPRMVKRGASYNASVVLSALSAGQGRLILSENGREIGAQEVTFAAGKKRFDFPLTQREPGYYEYVATIVPVPGGDFWSGNNRAVADLYLKGEGRILVATDAQSDAREWESLVKSLKETEHAVQVRMAFEMPREPLAFLPYDLVILPNAPAAAFDPVQLQALHDAVYHLGTGLLMLGSEHSFGPGGYRRTAIEEALPVEMDVSQKKVLPSAALLMALDSSGSMTLEVDGRTKMSLANRGAVLALRALNARDQFGVVSVDTYPSIVVPMGDHGAIDERTTRKVLDIRAGGGGIYVYTALAQAVLSFRDVKTNIKHVILFADAADAEQQTADPATHPAGPRTALELAEMMAATKITISVVALGRESDPDTEFLRELAARGRGRFYLTNDANQLPQIFVKEAVTLKRSMLQNRSFTPEVVFPSPVLKGLTEVPPLHGYVLTTPKARANVILQAPQLPDEVSLGACPDPILATWRYGLGTSAAWTSDFAPNWARDWMEWGKQRAFLKQLVTDVSRVSSKTDLDLSATVSGSQGVITVEDYAAAPRFLDVRARVFGPRRESLEIPLKQTANRRYEGQFPTWGQGRYQVAAIGTAGSGAAEQAVGGFAVPYSAEYQRFKSDPILLRQIAERTGGRLLAAEAGDVFQVPRQARESSQPIFDWFLICLAFLVPIDVAVRRIQLDWGALTARLRRPRREPSTETLAALLERKQRTPALPASLPATPVVPRPVPAPARAVASPSAPAAPSAVEPGNRSETTSEKLLARKRRRQAGGQSTPGA